jgi:hypothetical protein
VVKIPISRLGHQLQTEQLLGTLLASVTNKRWCGAKKWQRVDVRGTSEDQAARDVRGTSEDQEGTGKRGNIEACDLFD